MTTKPTKKTLRIILDSNSLFVPLQFKLDIFERLRILLNQNFTTIMLSPIRRELETLANEASPQTRKNASYALKLTEKCEFVKIDKETSADDAILETAAKWNCPVFTNDRQLRKKLRDINVPVIYVRQKSRLEIDGRL
jgi:rRNA-processing protein FCF1